jgi:hypothetical protein
MTDERKTAGQSSLGREAILKVFQGISDELARRGATGELCILGGTVMVLAFAARLSTKDVDVVEGLFAEGKV